MVSKSKLERLRKHPGTIVGDPDDIVHMDWSAEWNIGRKMIYLDTQVMLWLYERGLDRFPSKAKKFLDTEKLVICPMVFMELQFLQKIGRSKVKADKIYKGLNTQLDITFC